MSWLLKSGWYFLLLAIVGEILLPFILGLFYKEYRHSTMAISLLGNSNSPVRLPFNMWMLTAGILFLLSLPAIYHVYGAISKLLSILTVSFIALFAIGACIFSCFFSVNETKAVVSTASKIHGAGSAIGFMLLLFVPLWIALLLFGAGNCVAGGLSVVAFVLALVFFVLFIMADKPQFQNSYIAREGLWQRLNLLCMYLPLGYIAIINMV